MKSASGTMQTSRARRLSSAPGNMRRFNDLDLYLRGRETVTAPYSTFPGLRVPFGSSVFSARINSIAMGSFTIASRSRLATPMPRSTAGKARF